VPAIIIRSPSGEEHRLELSSRPILLGRAEDCDFVLRNDVEVSRHHAEIWADERGRVIVADRGSKNGTRVDDGETFRGTQRIAQECIRLGEHVIHIIGARPQPSGSERVVFAADVPAPAGADTQFFPSSRGFNLSQQRLTLLMQLTERIGGAFERKQLLEQALDACCEALGFERGLIVLRTPRGETELPVTRNVERDEGGAFKVSRTLINRALVHGERAIVNNPATDLAGRMTESLMRFPICSALCVPILNRDEILGVIYGDRITQGAPYQPEDVDFLAAIAQQVGIGLANLRLFQTHVESQRMYAELERARVIQKRLLPRQPLQIGRVRIEGFNQPSSAVSGDYFDYFPLEDGRVGVIIADVSGHGLPAALVMANLQSAVRVALAGDTDLPRLVSRLNRLICQNTSSTEFVTAVIGTVDPNTAEVDYVVAGHPTPIAVRPDGAAALDPPGSLALGIEPNERYEVARVAPGDGVGALLFYTDGLTEAGQERGNPMGLKPLLQALQNLKAPSTDSMIRAACSVVRAHLEPVAPADDMTLLALDLCHEPSSRKA